MISMCMQCMSKLVLKSVLRERALSLHAIRVRLVLVSNAELCRPETLVTGIACKLCHTSVIIPKNEYNSFQCTILYVLQCCVYITHNVGFAPDMLKAHFANFKPYNSCITMAISGICKLSWEYIVWSEPMFSLIFYTIFYMILIARLNYFTTTCSVG